MTERELNKEIAVNIVRLLDQKNRTQQELAVYDAFHDACGIFS